VVNAVAVLVVSCACAIVLATLWSSWLASGTPRDEGSSSRAVAASSSSRGVDTIVMDKTGTLTLGTPQVTDVVGV